MQRFDYIDLTYVGKAWGKKKHATASHKQNR